MSLQTNEQTVHDRINLSRLVKRLENSVTNEDWSLQDNQHNAWIKRKEPCRHERVVILIQSESMELTADYFSIPQKIKYARRLLKNVEADEPNPSSPCVI